MNEVRQTSTGTVYSVQDTIMHLERNKQERYADIIFDQKTAKTKVS